MVLLKWHTNKDWKH